MRNILSYQYGTVFTGAEINAWCVEQIVKHLGNEKIARRLYVYNNFRDERQYVLQPMQDDKGRITNYFVRLDIDK